MTDKTDVKNEEFTTDGKWFDIFNEEVDYWIKYFGLLEYELHITNEDEESLGALGTCWSDIENRIAGINLNSIWDEEPSEKRIRQIAFHEVMELLLGELKTAAYERETSDKIIVGATHTLIRRLENTIFKQKHKKHVCKCAKGGKNEGTKGENLAKMGLYEEMCKIHCHDGDKELGTVEEQELVSVPEL